MPPAAPHPAKVRADDPEAQSRAILDTERIALVPIAAVFPKPAVQKRGREPNPDAPRFVADRGIDQETTQESPMPRSAAATPATHAHVAIRPVSPISPIDPA